MTRLSSFQMPIQLVSTVLLATGLVLAQPEYKVVELGIAGKPTGINNRGDVVGTCGYGCTFAWDNGHVTYPALPRDACGINSRGAIAGGDYLFDKGGVTTLGLARSGGSAYALNDRDQVVGMDSDSDLERDAFVWEKGKMAYLPNLPVDWMFAAARAINNAGEIVGNAFNWDSSWSSHAVIWRQTGNQGNFTITDLGPSLGPYVTVAYGINNRGVVTGDFSDQWNARYGGFIWDHGTVTFLPSFHPRGINTIGELVGSILYRAAVWVPTDDGQTGRIIQFPELGTGFSAATAINDAGTVAGWYTSDAGIRAFIATRQ